MQSSWKSAYRYGNIGLELVLSIIVGFLLGRWLDRRFLGAHGYGTATGTVIGVYTGFRALWKMAKQAQAEAEADEARERVQADKNAKDEAYKKALDEPDKPHEG